MLNKNKYTKYTNYTNLLMDTNKKTRELFYPELSYTLVGILFSIHNELGQYAREKQYADLLEKRLQELKIDYKRELAIGNSGNIVDFLIDGKIILELKTVPRITGEFYRQIQNYLQQTGVKLGMLINFRNKYLKAERIVRIEKH
jgi:GxxExxY protein